MFSKQTIFYTKSFITDKNFKFRILLISPQKLFVDIIILTERIFFSFITNIFSFF